MTDRLMYANTFGKKLLALAINKYGTGVIKELGLRRTIHRITEKGLNGEELERVITYLFSRDYASISKYLDEQEFLLLQELRPYFKLIPINILKILTLDKQTQHRYMLTNSDFNKTYNELLFSRKPFVLNRFKLLYPLLFISTEFFKYYQMGVLHYFLKPFKFHIKYIYKLDIDTDLLTQYCSMAGLSLEDVFRYFSSRKPPKAQLIYAFQKIYTVAKDYYDVDKLQEHLLACSSQEIISKQIPNYNGVYASSRNSEASLFITTTRKLAEFYQEKRPTY